MNLWPIFPISNIQSNTLKMRQFKKDMRRRDVFEIFALADMICLDVAMICPLFISFKPPFHIRSTFRDFRNFRSSTNLQSGQRLSKFDYTAMALACFKKSFFLKFVNKFQLLKCPRRTLTVNPVHPKVLY